jgi:UDP-3-O-[3-hydroxymyristoyl] N-acetylglucosamine deacetylase / 3-hydroxyacyl-[acyl-carrier-protein] dehydratase
MSEQISTKRVAAVAPIYDPNVAPIKNAKEVEAILPHRYPFLLVDKVIEMTQDYIVAVKNVTFNEPHFNGHFPGNPVMPGVLQLEALAQCGGILCISLQEPGLEFDTYFLKIDNAKFKAMVVPGDSLILKMELTGPIRRGICEMRGTAFVGSKLVCEADMVAQIVKRN